MTVKNMSVHKHQEIHQITTIGNAIGNANLLTAIYDESAKFWNIATDSLSGNHLIQGIVLNNDSKSTAITDYALQICGLFISSKHPTLSLFTKRAFSLAVEHRKSVLYRMAAGRFNTNEELFRAVVTELLCFDPFVVDMSMSNFNPTFKAASLAKFVAAMLGEYVSEDDWNVDHEELVTLFQSFDFDERREDFINACLELSLNSETPLEFHSLLGQARDIINK